MTDPATPLHTNRPEDPSSSAKPDWSAAGAATNPLVVATSTSTSMQAEKEALDRTQALLTREVHTLEQFLVDVDPDRAAGPPLATAAAIPTAAAAAVAAEVLHTEAATGAVPAPSAASLTVAEVQRRNPFDSLVGIPTDSAAAATNSSPSAAAAVQARNPFETTKTDSPEDATVVVAGISSSVLTGQYSPASRTITTTTPIASSSSNSILGSAPPLSPPSVWSPTTTTLGSMVDPPHTTDDSNSNTDVESVATADFLQVPLQPERPTSDHSDDADPHLPSSSFPTTTAPGLVGATTTTTEPHPPFEAAAILPNKGSEDASLLGFDPHTYSYDGEGSSSDRSPLASTAAAAVAAGGVAATTALELRASSAADSPLDTMESTSRVSSGLASSSSYRYDDDEDDDDDEETAVRMMSLMSGHSSFTSPSSSQQQQQQPYLQHTTKPDLTLTDSQIYMTESEEDQAALLLMEEAQVALTRSHSTESGGSSDNGSNHSGSATSNRKEGPILSPVYASSDDGEYDHALDFFGDEDDDTTTQKNNKSTSDPNNNESTAPLILATAAAAAAAGTALAVSQLSADRHPSGVTSAAAISPLMSSAITNEKSQAAAAAAAKTTTNFPDSSQDAKPNLLSRNATPIDSPTPKADGMDIDDDATANKKGTITSVQRTCYLLIGVLFCIGIGALIFGLVYWSMNGTGSSLSTSPANPTETDSPTSAPSVNYNNNSAVTTAIPTPMVPSTPTVAPSINNNGTTNRPSLRGGQESLSPSMAPTGGDLFQLLVKVSLDDGASLRNQTSPQFRAFEWLADNANLSSYSDTKQIARYALATLYFSTGGGGGGNTLNSTAEIEPWLEDDLWLSDADECTWWSRSRSGPCSDTGAIQELELSYNNLRGTLPAELTLLADSLVSISIGGGPNFELSGSLSSVLGRLSFLQDLRLPGNSITGRLPVDAMEQWTSLQTLHLSDNRLTGPIPSAVGSMQDLQVLSLENNRMDGPLPSSCGNLTQLTTLNLANNRFMILPSDIGGMSNLIFLDLHENQFQGSLVSQIGQLVKLHTLTLAQNMFSGAIPRSFGLLENLTLLDLSNNQLSGTIPFSLGGNSSTWMTSPSVLRSLHLNGNNLQGSIPDSLVNLEGLQVLELQSNNLSGSMPTAICELFNQTFPAVYIDCEQVNCPCCAFCCDGTAEDESSELFRNSSVAASECLCRHLNTSEAWLCF